MLNLEQGVVDEVWSRGEARTSDKGSVASGEVLLINVRANRGKKEEKQMSAISGVGQFVPVQRDLSIGSRQGTTTDAQTAAAQESSEDRVELSGGSRPDISSFLAKLKSGDFRADKVASVKSSLEAGTYDEDSKLDVALSRLLGDLNV